MRAVHRSIAVSSIPEYAGRALVRTPAEVVREYFSAGGVTTSRESAAHRERSGRSRYRIEAVAWEVGLVNAAVAARRELRAAIRSSARTMTIGAAMHESSHHLLFLPDGSKAGAFAGLVSAPLTWAATANDACSTPTSFWPALAELADVRVLLNNCSMAS